VCEWNYGTRGKLNFFLLLINTLQKKQEERFDGDYFFGVGQLEEEEENCQLGEVKKNHHKSVQSSDADTFFFLAVAVS